jgi:hypothetical protein
VYSNWTTANTALPFTPFTVGLSILMSDVPSGQSEKNWRSLPGVERSMIG